MANRTASYAYTVHGTNPQYLIEKIIRTRIHESKYWKEHCTLLNSALVLEKAVDDLRYVGGVYGGNIKPTPFLCLALKLLQIQPIKEIIYLYIDQSDFKYLRALGAFYLRLVGTPVEIYTKLEPLLKDYRKLRIVDRMHKFSVIHMDELIDNLLREQRVFDVILPRLTKRLVLEENRDLEPYKSELEEQNLIPTQIIREKVELSKEENRRSRSLEDDELRHPSKSNHKFYHDSNLGRYSDDRGKTKRSDRYPSSMKSSGSRSRFSQEEIDNENAIRARVGLKPLK